MLTQEQAVVIRVMGRGDESVRAIAKQLECSRDTVRRYLRDESARRYGPRGRRPCKLDAHVAYLQLRIDQASPRWIPAAVLLRELRERLRRWNQTTQGVAGATEAGGSEPLVRFETTPGKQMQADFTYIRRGRDPLTALVATMG